jgi:hypothetical protein
LVDDDALGLELGDQSAAGVFDRGLLPTQPSIGARGMNDFPTYMKTRGKKYAKTRRRLYKMRHEKDRHVKGSNGYYADVLLW